MDYEHGADGPARVSLHFEGFCQPSLHLLGGKKSHLNVKYLGIIQPILFKLSRNVW